MTWEEKSKLYFDLFPREVYLSNEEESGILGGEVKFLDFKRKAKSVGSSLGIY
jgi:hypothetical protein